MFPWSGRQKVLKKLFVSSKNARFIWCVVSRTCMNLHENLMQETCASFLCKFLDCVSPPLGLSLSHSLWTLSGVSHVSFVNVFNLCCYHSFKIDAWSLIREFFTTCVTVSDESKNLCELASTVRILVVFGRIIEQNKFLFGRIVQSTIRYSPAYNGFDDELAYVWIMHGFLVN